MSDLQLPDRLTQLRSRWEADPASRIFLQLAEEYRHLGRLHEALAVLEAGLKEHPGYLSALVAKGRCLLDLGNPEPAREVLERVVRQDATQAVANKLLVRAYIETGQGDRARERLDLYSLLHDGDPEIAELRGRIRRLESGGPAAKPEKPAPPAPAAMEDEDPFSLPPPPKAAPVRAAAPVAADPPAPRREAREAPPAEDVFDLGPPPAPRLAAKGAVTDVFKLDYPVSATAAVSAPAATLAAPAPAPAASAVPAVALDELEPTPEGEPFPGLVSRSVRERYLSGLTAEGLFPLGRLEVAPPRSASPAPAAAPPEPEPFELAPAPPPPEPVHAPGEMFPLRSIGEAVEAELKRSTPEPEPVPEPEPLPEPFLAPEPEPAAFALEPLTAPELSRDEEEVFALDEEPEPEPPVEFEQVATVTLGELYLKQGHVGEAERIFEEVLRREPDNPAAKAAKEGLSHRTARGEEPAEPAVPGDRRQRKIRLLSGYLERIRRGSHPDVP